MAGSIIYGILSKESIVYMGNISYIGDRNTSLNHIKNIGSTREGSAFREKGSLIYF
jgi:hypothetical protein